ncbi:MBL fold metallo-hydrolase [Candidatus Peregrinibacteria bacterium]|jgi:metallo-beta-lactamase family protein|nr:MBL fold metallo-hydrolase [Candidatus Peregrinibacteria bacterium]MBT4631446.1 MBL fold metallo-hydrolase [Candidatus Peregrinibacteria bacterium]MBT5516905.1 MBL fold metallo-hydrolase [Candidatus Peregrinibacteria bacterium]MBT5823835.1 MBL fold metallo-hydrolase [Candidatus Peregrinibacteria bacterium]
MKLHFRGANKEVTGSRHLLEVNGKKILLDCGLYQGHRKEEQEKNRNFGFEPEEVDYVLLSHAHIDHSGNLPNLVKQGFNGPIYCTHATADLLSYMLMDSAYIQEREVEYINKKKGKKGETLLEPLYTEENVKQTLPLTKGLDYDKTIEVCEGVTATFREAGHILGSAIVIITVKDQDDGGKEKKLVFTGDLGRQNMPLIRDPFDVEEADYLITESTYGNRLHASILEAEDTLAEIVNATIERGGRLLIPAFSLGRTQEVVYSLHKMFHDGRIPDSIPIYVDSPLSVNLTSVFREHLEVLDEETQKLFIEEHDDPFGFERLKYIRSVEESKALNNHQGPCIIISSSGMVEHGRILHHLKNAIEDHRNTLLIVGYQAKNTLGRKLLEGNKSVNIFGEPHPVKIEVKVMNAYSAHADRSDLLDFASKIKGLKKVILVHGEEDAASDFKKSLEDNGFNDVLIPNFGDSIEL